MEQNFDHTDGGLSNLNLSWLLNAKFVTNTCKKTTDALQQLQGGEQVSTNLEAPPVASILCLPKKNCLLGVEVQTGMSRIQSVASTSCTPCTQGALGFERRGFGGVKAVAIHRINVMGRIAVACAPSLRSSQPLWVLTPLPHRGVLHTSAVAEAAVAAATSGPTAWLIALASVVAAGALACAVAAFIPIAVVRQPVADVIKPARFARA